MLLKSWQTLLRALQQGSLKVAARRLSKPDAKKYGSLIKEQRRLFKAVAGLIDSYDKKMLKISSLIERSRRGEMSRLEPHIRQLQQDLFQVLSRAEMAVAETADLQRELADWQRQTRLGQGMMDSSRPRSLISELEWRGCLNKQRSEDIVSSSELSPDPQEFIEQSEADCEPEKELDQTAATIAYPVDDGAAYLEPDPDHLVGQIRDLFHELALHEQCPDAEPSETLRLAKQIKELHALLRQVDRHSHTQRDRLEVTDGFRHVFT